MILNFNKNRIVHYCCNNFHYKYKYCIFIFDKQTYKYLRTLYTKQRNDGNVCNIE